MGSRRVTRSKTADIAAAIRRLLNGVNVVVNRTAAEAGLALLEAGGDFADGAIAYEGKWLGADTFVSFDKKAVQLIKRKAGLRNCSPRLSLTLAAIRTRLLHQLHHRRSKSFWLFLRQIMAGVRDDAMGAAAGEFCCDAVPSVAGATPSASPSSVIAGTVIAGSRASRRCRSAYRGSPSASP